MKKNVIFLFFVFVSFSYFSQSSRNLIRSEERDEKNGFLLAQFVRYAFDSHQSCAEFVVHQYVSAKDIEIKQQSFFRDEFSYTHASFKLFYKGVPLEYKVIRVHEKNGMWTANAEIVPFSLPANAVLLSEKQALQKALKKINASVYKWELEDETHHMRKALGDPEFTYYPKGELVLFFKNNAFYYAWKFNIYAHEPLSRTMVYVNAQNGEIIEDVPLICTISVPGTAYTKYSGVKSFTIDQNGSTYRLRDNTRGQGVETYNLQNTTNYASAVDFTNTSTTWSLSGSDHGIVDAHWGAQMSYDYYFQIHNRNSLDGNGYKLLSYCHYSTNYNNAFWDGQKMTYGDGNGTSFTIFTCLDVCGHELTHGLTDFTGGLNYQNESGALNESWSDIFGTCIENFGKPSGWNWKIGNEITTNGQGIRDMQNPKLFADPNCYQGQYWYTGTADNGGVHTNSGVGNYWFYLLTAGGTGTNDIGNSYTVTGIGMLNASKIAFRALTVYFTPSTNYANARSLTIQAAKDLFGACSNEVIQCTNAWYACGVGSAYVPGAINPNFTANNTSYCSLPATVNFQNTTANGLTYTWYFGDGSTSTATNPVHTYTSAGTYSVKLKATGCQSGVDSITKMAYITISPPPSPTANGASVCSNQSAVLTASAGGQVLWYASPTATNPLATGNTYTTPPLTSNTTYYVVNQVSNTPVSGGIPSNTTSGTSGGYLNNPAQYLIFDVTQPCTLLSVDVYAQTAGTRTFELRNSSSQVLASWAINLNTGMNTLNLNQNLTPGTSYQLGLNAASTASLFRTNSGVSYPYTISAGVNITGSSAGSSFYYWFYNWVVQKAPCKSAAVPVTVTVSPSGSASITSQNTACVNGNPITLSATPGGGTFSGTGVSGNQFNPSVGPGTFVISYSVSGGCSSSAQKTFTVYALPSVTVNNATICQGQSATLTAGGASTYTWNTGLITSQIVVNPSSSTVYSVSGTSAQGCVGSQTTQVTVNPLPNVSASASQTQVCSNGTLVVLTGSPSGGTFSGTGVSGNQFDPSVGTGTYTITYSYTDANSCSNSSQIVMVVNNCNSLVSWNPQSGWNVYPNPFSDMLVFKNASSEALIITVWDATGKLMDKQQIPSEKEMKIATEKWSKGLYMIRVEQERNMSYLKFIKE